jgi:hypothetical protein
VRRALPQQLEKMRVSLVGAPVWSLTMLFGLELWLQTFFSATLGPGGVDEMFVGPNVRQGSIPSNSLGEET